MERGFRKKYYLLYTLLFAVTAYLVYRYFWMYRKSFVDCGDAYGDGLVQHYQALSYYARYLRQILKTLLFEHRLEIPQWSFSIGYGSDIVATLHYYVIGDPFNLFSVFVPTRYLPYFYSGMVLVRLYCAGIAFSELCFYTIREKAGNMAVLVGSLVYIFGMYGMHAGTKHPYFLNPMIAFPLLLLGIEKILRGKNPVCFILTVCVSACSNFYFFYMLALLTALYVLLRLGMEYGLGRKKKFLLQFGKITAYAVLGLVMAMVIFLPVMLTILQDSRFGSAHTLNLLYTSKYYEKFLSGFLTSASIGNWNFLGFAGIALVSVLLMFQKKGQYRFLKVSFLLLTVFLLIPAAGFVLNACAYASNRWNWAYALAVAYITAVMWPQLWRMSGREKSRILIGLGVLTVLCLALDKARTENFAFAMLCTAGVIAVVKLDYGTFRLAGCYRRTGACLLLALTLFHISLNAYYNFSVEESNELKSYEEFSTLNSRAFRTQDVAVAKAVEGDTEFFRYAQGSANNNSTLASGLSSTQYYWSLSNPWIVASNETLGVLDVITHNNYLDQNSRTGLSALANVKYFTNRSGSGEQYAPYGYEYLAAYPARNSKDQWDVYKNRYALPFGYTYDGVLDEKEFEAMTPVEKEEAMLQGAYIQAGKTSLVPEKEAVTDSFELPYEIVSASEEISCQGQSFVATSDQTAVTLNFDAVADGELFLLIEGLDYEGCSPLDLYADETRFDPLNLYTERKLRNMSALDRAKLQRKDRNWTESTMPSLHASSTDQDGKTVSRGFYYITPDYTWYAGREDYTVNLGYSQGSRSSVTLSFSEAGIYSWKSLKLIFNPLEGYEEQIETLSEESLQNTEFGTDRISGDITLSANRFLCVSIPYAKGWSAYVDGEKTELLRTNIMYCGLPLEKGTHRIEFRYHSPGRRTGIVLSLLGMLGFACVLLRRRVSGKSDRDRTGEL